MTARELFDIVFEKAKEFGLRAKNNGRTIIDPKGNAVIRDNLLDISFNEGSAYFGFVNSNEDTSGPYSDLSFVVFPEKELGFAVVALGVGSAGFKDDVQLASSPGLRRNFLRLNSADNKSFFKTDFDDINSTSRDLLKEVRKNHDALSSVIDTYKTVLPACRILDLSKEESMTILFQWLAMYAKIRDWGTKEQKNRRDAILNSIPTPIVMDDKQQIKKLLNERKYVVIQGAPGTGKTYYSLEIAKEYKHSFFIQFHAETTYSDFVYGLEPNTEAKAGESQFKPKPGILYEAIKKAIKSEEDVILIIDEINRANLSNVLGPVFFLFEYQAVNRSVPIKIGDLVLSKLPDRLHVIATMNTADRSLAVVDFALRRRFAWYTIKPHTIQVNDKNLIFMDNKFAALSSIFFEYATDEELSLEPGPSYFIVPQENKESAMKDRFTYELMPLVKEYLAEGYLLKAKDSFVSFFLQETGLLMYE